MTRYFAQPPYTMPTVLYTCPSSYILHRQKGFWVSVILGCNNCIWLCLWMALVLFHACAMHFWYLVVPWKQTYNNFFSLLIYFSIYAHTFGNKNLLCCVKGVYMRFSSYRWDNWSSRNSCLIFCQHPRERSSCLVVFNCSLKLKLFCQP